MIVSGFPMLADFVISMAVIVAVASSRVLSNHLKLWVVIVVDSCGGPSTSSGWSLEAKISGVRPTKALRFLSRPRVAHEES